MSASLLYFILETVKASISKIHMFTSSQRDLELDAKKSHFLCRIEHRQDEVLVLYSTSEKEKSGKMLQPRGLAASDGLHSLLCLCKKREEELGDEKRLVNCLKACRCFAWFATNKYVQLYFFFWRKKHIS